MDMQHVIEEALEFSKEFINSVQVNQPAPIFPHLEKVEVLL